MCAQHSSVVCASCTARACAASALTMDCLQGCEQAVSLCAEMLAWQCRLMQLASCTAVPWSLACGQLPLLLTRKESAAMSIKLLLLTKTRCWCMCLVPMYSFRTSCTAVCTCSICLRHLSSHACALCMLCLRMHQLSGRFAGPHRGGSLGIEACLSCKQASLQKCVC